MVRHIFIAPIKEGIPEDKVDEKVIGMRELKNKVPEIIQLTIGKSTGWIGMNRAVTMVIDFNDKTAFETFLQHPYHVHIGETADDVFDTSKFIISQIEY